ncbi:UPF0061-domain-containing protein [Atractiella rhizophila]|nr:UPF0061-domain-containing protein [Atractiella rhizophila]
MAKKPISYLRLSPLSAPFHLPPDPVFPTPTSVLGLATRPIQEDAQNGPSWLRRSRGIREGGCFTYCTPLPLEFPYRVTKEAYEAVVVQSSGNQSQENDEVNIEKFLAALEPRDVGEQSPSGLNVYSSEGRTRPPFGQYEVLSISRKCAEECLPELDVDVKETMNVLAGIEVLGNDHWAPFALCYAGYQFGSFAGQLGDGRAITICNTEPPKEPTEGLKTSFFDRIPAIELQLKGAGRTPYSRFADGLAVTRSSIREYLCSEALASLDIPTTRSLSLIEFPSISVRRERVEKAAVVCRIAPTWLRIGSFEMQKVKRNWKSLKAMYEYVGKLYGEKDWVPILYERTGIMIARWQALGWMHGVMNTDNMSIFGLTIDLGPYAFMDVFDPQHICNHSDDLGRYRYSMQPSIALWNLKKLGEALVEVVGAAKEGKLDDSFGSEDIPEETWSQWREAGWKIFDELQPKLMSTFQEEYERVMFRRLGISSQKETDFNEIVSPFLDLMEEHALDYHSTFRILCYFHSTTSPTFSDFLSHLLPPNRVPSQYQVEAPKKWTTWLEKYERRLAEEVAGGDGLGRRSAMKSANPRFVLRQWVLEEVIKRVEGGERDILNKVLRMCENPFEDYGELDPNEKKWELFSKRGEEGEEERLCRYDGGGTSMLGFQCSCSS